MKSKQKKQAHQRGTAVVIALLVMALIMGFVVLALSRTTTETLATANDAAESRAFSAAEASLENMTRDLDKVFEQKLSPTTSDLTTIVNNNKVISGFSNYSFDPQINQLGDPTKPQIVVVSKQQLQGLSALRQTWEVDTTATDLRTGVKVKLRRQFFNDEVPIFQFGIFYDDDIEFHPGPRFDFGGRVHSNRNIYMMAQSGLYFSSRVDAVGQVVTDVMRNGKSWTNWGESVWVKNASGVYQQVKHDMGSALSSPTNGSNLFSYDSDMPSVYKNASWASNQTIYGGNLLAGQPSLDLPLAIDTRQRGGKKDYVELIKRGRNIGDLYDDKSGTVLNPKVVPVPAAAVDSDVTIKEKYANKSGVRISLSDTQDRLPGCAAPTPNPCGRQLDAGSGYQPLAMTDGYQATAINAARFTEPNYSNGVKRQNWIKVELVQVDASSGLPVTSDVTDDFLSLGVTEPAPIIKESGGRVDFQITAPNFTSNTTDAKYPDNRSVIKLQRWMMPGNVVKAGSSFLTDGFSSSWSGTNQNFVLVNTDGSGTNKIDVIPDDNGSATSNKDTGYKATVYYGAASQNNARVAPFPIMMFDVREGLYNESINTTTIYGTTNVPMAGVMSMVNLDVANLRRFFRGDFNNLLPTNTPYAASKSNVSLKNTDVPNKNGWVLYVSDRRGDYDFDGEYDMEDIYINSTTGNNDGTMQYGEDVNNDGILEADYGSPSANYGNEAPKYKWGILTDAAAVRNTQFYRRGVRLINGMVLPGNYDSTTPANTNGFTVASENGIYVQGNYNATGIRNVGTPTQSTDYLPQDTVDHIPASIVGDAITILSNSWSDANSFVTPFSYSNRVATETTDRFAILAGDTISSMDGTPNQGGSDTHLSGGVHNFKRFLENWSGVRLNYDGSLINLYNSHNNNGAFKCCSTVYSPPTRNWVFDATFLNPTRLPPGTPFFQSLSLTGFQRVNQ
ncbi:MAG: hypothetical protein ACR2GD_10775 [Pyrinomonadaceae bacterium]